MGSRFYVPPEYIDRTKIHVKGQEAHHIIDVMRMVPGDEVVIFDGKDKEYKGVIEQGARREVLIRIKDIKHLITEVRLELTLAQAIPRKGKMDYLVQKCTELGVKRIIPLATVRTVIKLNKAHEDFRRQRWQRIATQASKQSGRIKIAEVAEISSLARVSSTISSYNLALIACLDRQSKDLNKVLKDYKERSHKKSAKVIVFIGPEGDFTPLEINMAKKKGAIPVSLGNNILKSDTAAIASIAIVNYELG
jgi:16S rRNA (uracil1498-N3)-methyltransferase